MIEIGGLSISLAEMLGLLITAIGIWLVVRQLSEAKLASQMEGLLELIEQWNANAEIRKALADLTDLDEWDGLSDKEAYTRVYNTEQTKLGWKFLVNWYDLIGVLVQKKALDKGIVYDYIGPFAVFRWEKLEKVARHYRVERSWAPASNWEWLVNEFKKLK